MLRTARGLVIGITQFPATLNPYIGSMLAKSYVLAAMVRPTAIVGNDWLDRCMLCTELPTFENGRAETWTVTDPKTDVPAGNTGVRTTYTLKDDLFWGDGTPVTTADVVFAWEVGRHPESGVASQKSFEEIIDIEVVDAKTFIVVEEKVAYRYSLSGAFTPLPAHLERDRFGDPRAYRLESLYETDPTNPGLWNGPYRLKAIEKGSHVVLTRNETWKGKQPAFDEIVVRTIEKTTALEANLLSGAIDYIAGEMGLTLDQALAFEKRHGGKYDIRYVQGLVYEHIDLNLDNPILADARVRRALLHAVDRAAISEKLFGGKQGVADTNVHPLDRIHTDDVPKYPFDPDAANALLDEAGWTDKKRGIRHDANGEPLSLEIMTTAGNRARELVQQVLQSYWKRVGIDVRIRNEPARVFFGETVRKRKFTGLAMFAWLSSPERVPKTVLHSDYIPSEANNWSGQNATGYSNPEVDDLLDAIEVELDPDERKAMFGELQLFYATDLPVLPLYFRAQPFIVPTWLKGVEPTGHQYTTTLWVEEWRVE